MIYDKIENIDLYNIPQEAKDFIRSLKSDIDYGKRILNDKIYANVEEYKTRETGFFEAHKRYVDIQLLLSGEEIIEVTPAKNLKVKKEYDLNRDIAFYFDGDDYITKVKLSAGSFAVLYPHEAHKPQMAYKSQINVKKVVVKILAD